MVTTTSADLRVHNQVRLLRAVHSADAPLTRAAAARALAIGRNTAASLVGELERARLVREAPAESGARGRPTTLLLPHSRGPVAFAAEVREDTWTLARIELGGALTPLAAGEHDRTPAVFAELRDAVREHRDDRLAAVGVAIAGPIRDARRLHVSHLGWDEVDLEAALDLPAPVTVVGNDARLAGLAEARRGVLRGTGTALHFHVDFDVGGTLLLDGDAQAGAHGIAGEFGHVPFSGSTLRCMCGAVGCWSTEVGTNALLRRFGREAGYGAGRAFAQRVLADAAAGEAEAVAAVDAVASALGRGLGAFANVTDPETIGLSGLGASLLTSRRSLIENECAAALMAFRRADPPRIVAGTVGESGPLRGAAEIAFDELLDPEWIATRLAGESAA